MNVISVIVLVVLAVIVWRQGQRITVLEKLFEARLQPELPVTYDLGKVDEEPASQADDIDDPALEPAPPPPPLSPSSPITPAGSAQAGNESGFEAKLTQNWFVWLGAAILTIGSLFLVRAAADIGLLGPGMRLALAGLGGLFAMLAAEWLVAKTAHDKLNPLVPAALSAAGSAALFATAWSSSAIFGFITAAQATLLMGCVAFLTLILALRHGQLMAWLGIGGGIAAPMFSAEPGGSQMALFGYLAVLFVTSFMLMRWRPWRVFPWLLVPTVAVWPLIFVLHALFGDGSSPQWLPLAAFLGTIGTLSILVPASGAWRMAWLICFQIVLALTWLGHVAWQYFNAPVLVALLVTATLAILASRARDYRCSALVLPICALLTLLMMDLGPLEWTLLEKATTIPDKWNAAQAQLRPSQLDRFVHFGIGLAVIAILTGLAALRGAAAPGFWAAIAGFGPILVIAAAFLRLGADDAQAQLLAWLTLGTAAGGTLLTGWLKRYGRPYSGATAAMALTALAALGLATGIKLSHAWLPLGMCLIALAAVVLWRSMQVRALLLAAPWLSAVAAIIALFDPSVAGLAEPGQAVSLPTIFTGAVLPALILWAAATKVGPHRLPETVRSRLLLGAMLFAMLSIGYGSRWIAQGMAAAGLIEAGLRAAGWLLTMAWLTSFARGSRLYPIAWLAHAALIALIAAPVLLISQNPLIYPVAVGKLPIVNALLTAYGLPALALGVLAFANYRSEPQAKTWVLLWGALALAATLGWLGLEIRRTFHGQLLNGRTSDAELYAYSLLLIAAAAVLLGLGIRFSKLILRRAGIGMLILTLIKLFVLDLAHLDGMLRALSFVGLGLSLIAVGYAMRRWLVLPNAPTGQTTA